MKFIGIPLLTLALLAPASAMAQDNWSTQGNGCVPSNTTIKGDLHVMNPHDAAAWLKDYRTGLIDPETLRRRTAPARPDGDVDSLPRPNRKERRRLARLDRQLARV